MTATYCARAGCVHLQSRHVDGSGKCCVKPVGHCPAFLAEPVPDPSPSGQAVSESGAVASEVAGRSEVVIGGDPSPPTPPAFVLVGGAGESDVGASSEPVRGTPSVTTKSVVKGTFTRSEMPPAGSAVSYPTVQVFWSDCELTQGVRSRAPIETVLNTAVSRGYAGVRLRLMMGRYAPNWAKALGSGPVTYVEPQGGATATIPDLWDTAFQTAAANFWAWVAAEFDDDPRLLAVFTTGAMTYYGEPCIRGAQNATTRANLVAAGYTIADDLALQRRAIDWMSGFVKTPVGLSYNPMQEIDSPSAWHSSVSDMADLMDYHMAACGDRTILQNNSIRASYISSPPPMYAELISRSATVNTQYQVAGAANIGSPIDTAFAETMDWACSYLGASGVELVNGYANYATDTQIRNWDACLRGNGPAGGTARVQELGGAASTEVAGRTETVLASVGGGKIPVVAGTWVLQQVASAAAVRNYETKFNGVLSHPGITGLSIRVPWNKLEPSNGVYDFSAFDEAKRIADNAGKPLAVRFMCGQNTPTFHMGRTYIATGTDIHGNSWTATLPCPFNTDGSPNMTFETGWFALADALYAWCIANGVQFYHAGWWGGRWAELYLDDQQGLTGYTYAATRDAHFDLLDYVNTNFAAADFYVEFPISGFDGGTTIRQDVANRMKANNPNYGFIQSNNIDESTVLAAYAPPPRRGWQMLDQIGYTNWDHIYAECFGGGEYLEIYTNSFFAGNVTGLYADAAKYSGSAPVSRVQAVGGAVEADSAGSADPVLASTGSGFDTMILAQGRTLSSNIPTILSHAGVVGVSHAFPWTLIEPHAGVYDFSWLDAGLAVARSKGRGYAPRFRTGLQTPTFHMGRTWTPTDGPGAGKPCPMPVETDGSPNATFLAGFIALLDALGAWCDANLGSHPADGPLHGGWFGSGSSELFVDDHLFTLAGATDANVLAAHVALLDAIVAAPTSMRVELPISGLQAGAHLTFLQNGLYTVMSGETNFWTQRNGFSDGGTGAWKEGAGPPPHGLQMIKAFRVSDGLPFNWDNVYTHAVNSFTSNPSGDRGFLEVYEQSFTGSGSASLYTNAASHA